MRIDGDCRPAEGGVQHDVSGFAPDAGKRVKRGSVFRYFAVMLLKQDPAGLNDVFCFTVEQADGLNVRLDAWLLYTSPSSCGS